MNIANAQFVKEYLVEENAGIKATIDGIEMFIPLDPANHHYAEIMRQVEAGTLTITPADEE